MATHLRCRGCTLLFCDFVSRECRLSPGEVARLRPDLLLTYKPEPTAGVPDRSRYSRNVKRNERAEIAVRRYNRQPGGVFARRRMKRLREQICTM